jgi:hypothetical protein
MLNTLPMDVLELVIAHLARDPYSLDNVSSVFFVGTIALRQ